MRIDIAVDSANGEATVCRAVKEDSTGEKKWSQGLTWTSD